MGLVSCNSCGHDVSENAVTCPHCGQPKPGLHGLARVYDEMGGRKPSSFAGYHPDAVAFMKDQGIW